MNLHIGKFFDRYFGIPLCGILYLLIHAWEVIFQKNRDIQVKKILLLKMWGVGNLMLILPALEALQKKYPKAKILFLTLKSNRGLLEGHPFLDPAFCNYLLHLWRDIDELPFPLRIEPQVLRLRLHSASFLVLVCGSA